jgi:aryl-alcohol dehydrogenase
MKASYRTLEIQSKFVDTLIGAGVVRATGSQVSSIKSGDHVVLSYNFCTSCRSCEDEKPYQCEYAQRMNFGGSRSDGSSTIVGDSERISTCFFGQSSFCNPTIAQEASCVKIDKSLPLSVVCALGCGFQTGTGAIYNVVGPVERNLKNILIFGIGGVGCAAIMAAHQLTTSSGMPLGIIAADINESRLALAKDLGATHTIDSRAGSTQDAVMRLTKQWGVDAVIDCTGSPTVINEMLGLLGPGGIAVNVGGPSPGTKVAVDVFDMLIKCKTYSGCHQGNAYSKTVGAA